MFLESFTSLSQGGLKIAKEEIEATQGLYMPLMPQWLVKKEAIKTRYNNRLNVYRSRFV